MHDFRAFGSRWSSWLYGKTYLSNPSLREQLSILTIYSLLAILSLVTFGFLHILIENNPVVGYLELTGACVLILNLAGLRFTKNVPLTRVGFLITLIALLVVMLTTGGTQGTGIFWFFMFPVSAFFLSNKKQGVIWVTALFLVIISLMLLAQFTFMDLWYSMTTLRQLLISLLVVSVGIYAYQASREKAVQTVDHAKSEFLTLASHQLRTPLSGIKWSSEILLHGDAGKLNPEQHEYIQQIYNSNERSTALVDAMLMVSRLEIGNVPVKLELIDLPALCHAVLKKERKNIAAGKKLHFNEKHDDNLPKFRGDIELITTVLRNILSNAIKYTPDGGRVSVTIDKTGERLSLKSRGTVRIAVSDTGYSIPKAEQKDIFAKMFRASNVKARDTDGTGLGLYIVKAILDQVGGEIHFTSQENKGSTFYILLPIEGMKDTHAAKTNSTTEKVHV